MFVCCGFHLNRRLQYGQSKLANILFSNELSKRYSTPAITADGHLQRRISSNSLHPGTIQTELMRHMSYLDDYGAFWSDLEQKFYLLAQNAMFMSPDDGALTQVLRYYDLSTE